MKTINIFAFATILFAVSCNTGKPLSGKLRECPERFFEDRMPQIIDPKNPNKTPRAYFIYKGQRRELSEFDTAWVRKNCNVEKQVVY
ncbi:MAG: hypothetical protein BGN92_01475 [Sphingobacteriales bacterium 41-5]|nr:MAG: hypothetical protein ABS67_03460 [Niabella sp. SCN 42-15]OJU27716.1 MAG: hypothetical protein BGN92_01475 [Sphingobacteriales bacterium 41-5]